MAHNASARAIGRFQRLAASGVHHTPLSCAMSPIITTNASFSPLRAISAPQLGMLHHLAFSPVSIRSGDCNLRHFTSGSRHVSLTSCLGSSCRDSTQGNRMQSCCTGLSQRMEQQWWPAPLQGGTAQHAQHAQHARHFSVSTGGSSPKGCMEFCLMKRNVGACSGAMRVMRLQFTNDKGSAPSQ